MVEGVRPVPGDSDEDDYGSDFEPHTEDATDTTDDTTDADEAGWGGTALTSPPTRPFIITVDAGNAPRSPFAIALSVLPIAAASPDDLIPSRPVSDRHTAGYDLCAEGGQLIIGNGRSCRVEVSHSVVFRGDRGARN